MRWLYWTLSLCLFSLNTHADPIKRGTLHLVGDSQACGAGAVAKDVSLTRSWSAIVTTCKVSTQTSYWHDHIAEAGLKPGDTVIIYLGSNDWARPDPKPILAKIRASGAKCVWNGPPLIRGKDNGVASHLKRAIEADGTCRFLDSRELHLVQGDGVHPGPSEHRRWLTASLSRLGV